MKKYKVSVCVPIYNAENYLEECLDSLVNQTLKEIESVCVNDGSTDNSLKILEDYAQRYGNIKIINQENQGLGGLEIQVSKILLENISDLLMQMI